MTAHNRDVALVERQRDAARDFLLCAFDERIQSLAQRREPQTVINQLGVFESDVLFKMHDVALAAESFEFAMSGNQQGSSWCFVAPTRLDSNEAVLDNIHAANR